MNIYLNSLGLINPLGHDKNSVWQNLIKTNASGLCIERQLVPEKEVYVGKVNSPLMELPKHLSHYNNRNNQMLLTAFKQIEDDFKKLTAGVENVRIAIILGTSTGAMDDAEEQLANLLNNQEPAPEYHFINQEIGGGDQFLADYLELEDSIHYTVSTACSSSAKALIAGKRLIENDMADLIIAGGADSLCKLTLNGFNALESLSKEQCRPFSDDRDGINIGEGAALFLISKQPAPISLVAAGETSDAYHMSAPDPDATGAINAMRQALSRATLSPDDIDYLNLHGTATIKNDEMEAKAIQTVFNKQSPMLSSTKHLTGHMLGAAGVNELAFCWLAMQSDEQLLPMNQDAIAQEFSGMNFVTQNNRKNANIRHCMSNSFAFGGNNISVILSKEKS